jgi:hypothetical protein
METDPKAFPSSPASNSTAKDELECALALPSTNRFSFASFYRFVSFYGGGSANNKKFI